MNSASRFAPSPHQRGNTLIGIIIGLVIGLGIAVIVALAITKGATPFTDKAGKSKPAEPSAGQIADPNKPMYGNKDAVREAARDIPKENLAKENAPKESRPPVADALQEVIASLTPGRSATPAPAPVRPPAPSAPVVAAQAAPEKARPATTTVPNPVAAAAPTAAPATPAAAPVAAKADASDEKYVYYLQVGAFRETADAESARAKLALLGFEAAVTDRSTDSGVLHRVRMGPFNQVEAMNRARTKLSENGVDVAVVRNQK